MTLLDKYKEVFNFFHFTLIEGNDKNLHISIPIIQKEGDRFEIKEFRSRRYAMAERSAAEFQLELFFVSSPIYRPEVLEEVFINWAPGVNDVWVSEKNGFFCANIGLGNGEGYHSAGNHRDKEEALLNVMKVYLGFLKEKNDSRKSN